MAPKGWLDQRELDVDMCAVDCWHGMHLHYHTARTSKSGWLAQTGMDVDISVLLNDTAGRVNS